MNLTFYLSIILLIVSSSFSEKLSKDILDIDWLCGNVNCSTPISNAKPKFSYKGDHFLKVDFKHNDKVSVLGKPVNTTKEFWLVSVNNKVGVAQKTFLKELDILVKTINCVSTKYKFDVPEHSASNISPSPTQEIFDGTTISYAPESKEEVTATVNKPSEDSEKTKVFETEQLKKEENFLVSEHESPENTKNQSTSKTETLENVEKNLSLTSKLTGDIQNVQDLKNDSTKNPEDIPFSINEVDNVLPAKISIGNEESDKNADPAKTNILEPVSENHGLQDVNEKLETKSLANGSSHEKSPSISSSNTPENDITSASPSSVDDYFQGSTEATKTESDSVDSNTLNEIQEEKNKIPSTSINIESDLPSGTNPIIAEFLNNTSPVVEKSGIDMSPTELLSSENLATDKLFIANSSTNDLKKTDATEDSIVSSSVLNVKNNSDGESSLNSSPLSSPHPVSPTKEEPYHFYKDSSTDTSNTSETQEIPTEKSQTFTVKYDTNNEQPLSNSNEYVAVNHELNSEKDKSDPSQLPTYNSQETLTPADPLSFSYPSNNAKQDDLSQPNVLSDYPLVDSYSTSTLSEIEKSVVSDITPVDSFSNDSSTEPNSVESSSSQDANFEKKYTTPEDSPTPVEEFKPEIPLPENPLPSEDPILSIENSANKETEDSSTNWFSPVSRVISSVKDMFSKSDIGVDDSQTIYEFTTESTFNSLPLSSEKGSKIQDKDQTCESDQFCYTPPISPPTPASEDHLSFSIPGLKGASVTFSTFIYLTVTSSVVLLFSLGYYYLENLKRESTLVTKINSLSAELFFAQKELTTMEEQMTMTSENFKKLASNSTVNNEELIRMKQDLKKNEAMKQGLELEIKRLEKEIESLVESNDEMHKMLTESITEEDRSQALLSNIADLKSVLSDRLEEITTLTNQLDKEKQEVELLTIALQKTEEKKENLEEKLQNVIDEIDSKALAVTKEFEEKVSSLEKIIEESSLERTNFEKQLCELKAECEKLSAEKELAEKSLKKAQGLGPGKAHADWLDAKEARVELVVAQKEMDKLRRQLEEAKEHEAKLQEQKNELQVEIETLNNNYETAEKNKIEALTKLQVLSNYFKEKETQLQEELGEKEAQWLQKQSEDHTIYEQMRSLREENLSYKAQNEALKKEILDQEASYKIQIANEEQKSQEHWVTLRHTERRLKEAQMEAAHLRSRLTAIETNADSLDEKHKSLEIVDGDVSLGPGSPPFMLYPPPPPDFIPPPPLVSPSRPPPLGRLSSPPLTPPPPLSPFDLYPPLPSAPSPPALRGVIKPQPREPPHNHRKQKESQSSNHSSESMERPIRRGKR